MSSYETSRVLSTCLVNPVLSTTHASEDMSQQLTADSPVTGNAVDLPGQTCEGHFVVQGEIIVSSRFT